MTAADAMTQVVDIVVSLEEEDRIYLLSTLLTVQMIHSGLGWSECQIVLAMAMKRATDGFMRELQDQAAQQLRRGDTSSTRKTLPTHLAKMGKCE